jgi:protein O-mannosyl-transferase
MLPNCNKRTFLASTDAPRPLQTHHAMDDSPRRNRRFAAAVCGLLLLLVAIVFARTLQCEFVNFDDDAYVYNNPHVSRGLSGESTVWSFTTFHSCNWHPLTWLSHALDCQLYGTQHPGLHHLTNVVLHAAVVIALFLVLWQMTGGLWPSAFVAAVFAVHPLRVESVAWVAERKDLLSGLFFMLTLAAYLHYVRHPFSWRRYLLVIAMFVLGLMSKPMLVTLPFVLLLLDYWPLGRLTDKPLAASHARWSGSCTATPGATVQLSPQQEVSHAPWQRLIAEKLPLLLLAVASSAVTSAAQQQALVPVDVVPVSSRIANALVSYVAYLGQFFYPVGLAAFYPHPQDGLPTWKIAAAAVALIAISAAALLAWRRFPYFFVGWFWYVGMLVPVIGIVQVGSQAMADRYTYLPQIGLCIALAWGAAAVGQTFPSAGQNAAYRRWANAIGSTLLIVTLMACTWRQTSHWQNSETLWAHAVACTPQDASLHDRLGGALADNHKLEAAVAEYHKAIEINPESASAHNNLGKTLAQQGRTDAAAAEHRKAIELKPDYADAHNNLGVILANRGRPDAAATQFRLALKSKPDFALAHSNLAKILTKQGRDDEAILKYRSAIESDPYCADVHNDLGVILAKRGQLDAAIAEFRSALAIKPSLVKVRANLAQALGEWGKIADAVVEWREVVRLQPNNLRAVNQLAWAMATDPEASVRNGPEAAELAQWAVKLSRGLEPIPLGTLAAAYAEMGRFTEAVTIADRAIALATARNDATTADALRRQNQRYRAGSPYHEQPHKRVGVAVELPPQQGQQPQK